MKSTYKGYTIEVFNDSNYWPHSVDNLNSYDFEYPLNSEPFSRECSFTTTGIIVRKDSELISSAIICEPNGITIDDKTNYLIENDRVYICARNLIYALNIYDLSISWRKEIDNVYCLGLFRLEEDILVHGELEIHRIDLDGNIKWRFSGSDILLNIEGKNELTINKDFINLIDFNGKDYKIDLDGKIIKKKRWWKMY